MCIFCAAIPLAASMGTAISAKEKEKRHQAIERGEVPPRLILPPGKTTAVVLVGLAAGSVIYHTVIFPRTGI